MEKGGMEGGMEWCSLTWARRRPCPIMRASCRSQAVVSGAAIIVGGFVPGCSFSSLAVRFRWWAFAFTGGHSLSLVGIRFRWWGVVFAGGGSFALVGVHFRWWACVFIRGHSFSLVGGRLAWW